MADKIDPQTGLPEKSKNTDVLIGLGGKGKTKLKIPTFGRMYSIDPTKYTSPINIDENIEGADNFFKTLMQPEELVGTNIATVEKKFQERYNQAVFDRQMQLHDDQSIFAKGLKGATRFAGSTIVNIVGGVAGTVYGAGKALATMDGSKFYQDNEVFDALDVVQETIDENTVIYGEPGYHGRGFFDKMVTDPSKLFLEEGSSAAAFVAGAVLTEVFTAGYATPAIAARLGSLGRVGSAVNKGVRVAKGVDLSSDAAKIFSKINQNARASKYLRDMKNLAGTSRALMMGAGYEASLEARENYEQVLHKLIEDYKEVNNGKNPSELELKEFEEAAKQSSLYTFGGNIITVGASNLLQFPKIFWKGYSGQRNLFKRLDPTAKMRAKTKIDPKTGEVVTKWSQKGKFAKGLALGYHGLKNPVREGLEEYTQGMINNTTLEYYTRKYSPDSNREAISMVEAMTKAWTKMVSGPEGSNAFGMGFLMGLVGLPGVKMKDGKLKVGLGTVGGTFDSLSQFKEHRKNLEDQVTEINKNGAFAPNLKAMFENVVNNMSIQEELDEVIATGDVFRAKNLEHDQFFSYIRGRQKLGLGETVLEDLNKLEEMSLEEFNENYNLPEVAEFTEETKAVAIEKAREYVQRVLDNSELVEKALDRNNILNADPDLVEELIHSASVLDNVDKREEELSKRISDLSQALVNAKELGNLSKKRQQEESKLYPVPIRRKEVKKSLNKLEELIRIRQEKGLTKNQQYEFNQLKDNLRLTEFDIDSLIEVKDKIDYTKLRQLVGEQELVKGETTKIETDQALFEAVAEEQMKVWQEQDPTGYAKNKDEVEANLEDILKLKERREKFIGYYNYLFTGEGMAAFNKFKEALAKQFIDEIVKNETESAKAEGTSTARKNATSASNQSSPESGQKTKEELDKQKMDNSVNSGKIDISDETKIREQLENRYKNNKPLYEQEIQDIQDKLNEELDTDKLINIKLPFSELQQFLSIVHSNLTEAGGNQGFNAVIKDFYGNINDHVDKFNNSTHEEDDSENNYYDENENEGEGQSNTFIENKNNFIQNREFEIEKIEDGYYILKRDKDGQPIEAANFAKMSKDDFEFINDPNTNLENQEAEAFIDPDDVGNPNNPKIKIRVIKDGKSYILGVLPALKVGMDENMSSIVGAINIAYEKHEDKKSEFIYENKIILSGKGKGMINFSSPKNTPFENLEDPNKIDDKFIVKNDNGKPLLGYGKGYSGTTVVSLEVPGSNLSFPQFSNIQPGAIYMFIQGANNQEVIPVRLKPRKLDGEQIQTVMDLLNKASKLNPQDNEYKQTLTQINKITPLSIKRNNWNNTVLPTGQIFVRPKKGWEAWEDVYQLQNAGIPVNQFATEGNFAYPVLGDLYVQIDKATLNDGKNDEILGNLLRTNVNLEKPVVNANATINLKETIDSANIDSSTPAPKIKPKAEFTPKQSTKKGKFNPNFKENFTEQEIKDNVGVLEIYKMMAGAEESLPKAVKAKLEGNEGTVDNLLDSRNEKFPEDIVYNFDGGNKVISVYKNGIIEVITIDNEGTFARVTDYEGTTQYKESTISQEVLSKKNDKGETLLNQIQDETIPATTDTIQTADDAKQGWINYVAKNQNISKAEASKKLKDVEWVDLYRAEGDATVNLQNTKLPEWQAKRKGTWFTKYKKVAKGYLDQHPNSKLYTVKVPKVWYDGAVTTGKKVGMGITAKGEVQLPREVADSKILLSEAEIDPAIITLRNQPKRIVNPKNKDEYVQVDEKGAIIPNTEAPRVSTLKGKYTAEDDSPANRGTLIDNLFRDVIVYFNQNKKNITREEFAAIYKKESEDFYDKGLRVAGTKENPTKYPFSSDFLTQLHDIMTSFIDSAVKDGITLYSDIPTIAGELQDKGETKTYAGTVDFIGVKPSTGEKFIIDLKSSYNDRTQDYLTDTSTFKEGDAIQLAAYQEIIKQITGEEFQPYFLPVQTEKGYNQTEKKEEYTKATAKSGAGEIDLVTGQIKALSFKDYLLENDLIPSKRDNLKPSETTGIAKKVSTRKPPKRRTRQALLGQKNYTKWDKKQELSWLKKNLPKVPVSVLEDLYNIHQVGGLNAWGLFAKAAIYLQENAGKGTTYHEAFHAVFNLMLSPKERQKILTEAQAKYGLQDEIALEEQLADDFMDFIISKVEENAETIVPAKQSWLRQLFNRILRMLNLVNTKKLTIDSLFNDIAGGRYAGRIEGNPLKRNVKKFEEEVKYKIAGFNYAELSERKNMLIHDIISNIEPDISVDAVVKRVKASYKATIIQFVNEKNEYLDAGWTEEEVSYIIEQYQNVIDNFEALLNLITPLLPSYGYNIKKDEGGKYKIEDGNIVKLDEELNDVSTQEETVPIKESWQESKFEKSTKDTVTNSVRKNLTRIPLKYYDKNGEVEEVYDSINNTKYVPYDELFNTLKTKLVGSQNFAEMRNRLTKMAVYKPYINDLLVKLDSDPTFKSGFFSAMATAQANYMLLTTQRYTSTKDGQRTVTYINRMFNPNRNTPEMVVIDEWKNNFEAKYFKITDQVIDPELKDNLKNNLNIINSSLEKLENRAKTEWVKEKENAKYNSSDYTIINNLSKALNDIGFTFSPEDLREIFRPKREAAPAAYTSKFNNLYTFQSIFNVFSEKLNQGKNIFIESTRTSDVGVVLKRGETKEGDIIKAKPVYENREVNLLKELAEYYSDLHLEVFENSFKNVENKTLFSVILPSHMANLITNLTAREVKGQPHERTWYDSDPFYKRNKWIQDLKSHNTKKIFEIFYTDGIKRTGRSKGKKYTKMSEIDLMQLNMQMFYNRGHESVGNYSMPILADSPQKVFVAFKKYSNEEVLDALFDVALQEYERNEYIKKNKDNIQVSNYTPRYVYFPFLSKLESNWGEKPKENKQKVLDLIVSELLDPEIRKTVKKMVATEMGYINKENKFVFNPEYRPSVSMKQASSTFIQNYIYNSTLANMMASQIFSGDIAFYKEGEEIWDFSKRNKQISVPGRRIDAEAIGETYKTIFTEDEYVTTRTLNELKKAIRSNKFMTKKQKKYILTQWETESIEATDGQAFISLKRYKDILVGSGLWTDAHKKAWPNIVKGKGNRREVALFLQPIKPFVFAKIKIGNKIVPIQNKNSEYAILPQLVNTTQLVNGKKVTVENPRIKKMLDIFDTGVDSIQFKSAVKVGGHNLIAFDQIPDSAEEMKSFLHGTETEKGKVINLFNKDYSIVVEVPQHFLDTTTLFGSQIRKFAISDLVRQPDYKYDIEGKQMTSKEIVDLWQNIIKADISEDLQEIAGLFQEKDDKKLHKILEKEIIKRGLGQQYLDAIQLDENGKFKYPLFAPFHAKRTESLLNSLFTNNVINQKIKGGSLVQVSDFGMSEKLDIVYNEEGGIQHLEVMMPVYSTKYFEEYREKDGTIDIERIEKENPKLLEIVGFRIPTEKQYSFPPMKIVGFLPEVGGGAIILPAEFIKMAGTDFDIDKLYMMFNSFRLNKKGKYEYIEYDTNENNPLNQSREARDNMKIAMIRQILQDPSMLKDLMTPGGFQKLKDIRETINEIRGKTEDKLNLFLPSTQIDLFTMSIAGTQLVGIMANQSASHAMLQHTSLEFKNYTAFKVNGEFIKLKDLNRLKTLVKDEDISSNLAIFLAASVDNTKDPVLGALNVNLFTSNVLTTLVRQGLDLETAMFFINQPVILKFAESYFNKGATPYSAIQAYNELEEKLLAMANIPNMEEMYPKYRFSTMEDTMLRKGLELESLEGLSEEDARNQLRVLNIFDVLDKKSEDLAKVVKAFRADSIKAGPTMAANSMFIDNYLNVTGKKLASFNDGEVAKALQEYSMQSEFANVIFSANQNLGKYLIWRSPIFNDARKKLQAIKGKTPLQEDEIEFLNYNLFSYFATEFDFFDLSKPSRNEKITEMDFYINRFPAIYQRTVDQDEVLRELLLTRLISIDTKVDNPEIKPKLRFNTDSKLSPEQRDTLYYDFMYLLESNNEEYRQLAEDLIKYSFAVSGLRFAPYSINTAIPIQAFDIIKDSKNVTFNDFLKYQLEDKLELAAIDNEVLEDNSEFSYSSEKAPIDRFMTGFIRNFAHRFDYITEVDLKKEKADIKLSGIKNGFPTSIKINIATNIGSNVVYTLNGERLAKDFITYTERDTTYLYKLMGTSSNGNEVYYAIQTPLGIPNRAQELGVNYEGNIFFKEHNLLLKSDVPNKNNQYLAIYLKGNDLQNLADRIEKYLSKNIEDYFFLPDRYSHTINQSIDTKENQNEPNKGEDIKQVNHQVTIKKKDSEGNLKTENYSIKIKGSEIETDLDFATIKDSSFTILDKDNNEVYATEGPSRNQIIFKFKYNNKAAELTTINGKQYFVDLNDKTNVIDVLGNKIKDQKILDEIDKEVTTVEPQAGVNLGTETAPAGGNVVIDTVKGKKPQPGAVVAFRTKGKTEQNMIDALEDNAVGNPFGPYAEIKEKGDGTAVTRFLNWLEGTGDTTVMQDYRNALLAKVPELKGKTIYYYKDLGRPSHATALDYFLNKATTQPEVTGKAPTTPKVETKYLTTVEQYMEKIATIYSSAPYDLEDESLLSVETFGGQKVVVDERGIPIKRKKGYKDFYALNQLKKVSDTGTEVITYFFRKTYAKKVNIPGYEMLNTVVLQWSESTYKIFEASSGLGMGGTGTTIKETIEDQKNILDKQKNIENILSTIENSKNPIISIANAAFIEEKDSGKAPISQEYKTVQDVSNKNPQVVFAIGDAMPTKKGHIFEGTEREIGIYPELKIGSLYVFDNNKTPIEVGYKTTEKDSNGKTIVEVSEDFNIENLTPQQINLFEQEFNIKFREKDDLDEDNTSEIPLCPNK